MDEYESPFYASQKRLVTYVELVLSNELSLNDVPSMLRARVTLLVRNIPVICEAFELAEAKRQAYRQLFDDHQA